MLSTITVALSTPPNITVLTPLISCAIMTSVALLTKLSVLAEYCPSAQEISGRK